jgi:uncharacterized Zn-binding protein involved in type VI secretion
MAYKSESESEPVAPPKEPAAPPEKKKREAIRMTDKQKLDLKRHMDKLKKDGGMSLTEQRSHRMKMMSRMRKGDSVKKAHKDIMK